MAAEADLLVLGAGPAGLAAAWRAARHGQSVLVLERAENAGGMAASFEIAGMSVDYGSHRLSPATPPHILADLRTLLGADLQTRYRTGRILLGDRWVTYPFKPRELAKALPRAPRTRVALDALSMLRPKAPDESEASYADLMRAGFGPTLYQLVYEPYARKLWGVSGDELDADQARRKAGAPTAFAALTRAVRAGLAGESLAYLYPRRGFGQLTETLADAAIIAGARIALGTTVERVELREEGATVTAARSESHSAAADRVGRRSAEPWTNGGTVRARHVFSTLPLPQLARLLVPSAPYEALAAASELRFRALLLVYAVHEGGRWSGHDVHYLPSPAAPVTRISEPANHRINPDDPSDRSVICFEIPCQVGDELWSADERQLADLVQQTVRACALPPLRLAWVQVKRLRHGYPVHHAGYRDHLAALESWINTLPRLTTLGRQGLFTPDNVHHALDMGYQAADALGTDAFDHERWQASRREFTAHLIET